MGKSKLSESTIVALLKEAKADSQKIRSLSKL